MGVKGGERVTDIGRLEKLSIAQYSKKFSIIQHISAEVLLAANIQTRLRGYASSPEPFLFANAISTSVSCVGSKTEDSRLPKVHGTKVFTSS